MAMIQHIKYGNIFISRIRGISKGLASICFVAVMIGGCTVGPDYKKPVADSTMNWDNNGRPSQAQLQDITSDWWTVFKDPLLEKYISRAIKANHDLKIARLNVREARILRGLKRASYYPKIGAKAGVKHITQSENGLLPISEIPGMVQDQDIFDSGFDANWEIDIFGHTRRSVEVAEAFTESRIEQRRDILLSVLSEVARNYFEIRGLQRRLSITEKNINLQHSAVDLVTRQLENGVVSNFDLERARAQLQVTEARLPNLKGQLRMTSYRLALLLGQRPGKLIGELKENSALAITPDVVPVGLPSDMLRRRPDVRQAERELASATAQIGVDTSNLYPRFSLTGSVGLEATTLGDLIKGSSVTSLFGGGLNWPLFQGGQARLRIKASETRADIAITRYEQKILMALKDVETSLYSYGRELETHDRLNHARDTAKSVSDIAHLRYKHGVENFLAVLDANRALMNREDELVQSETRSLIRLITLFKNLGGGWEIAEQKS